MMSGSDMVTVIGAGLPRTGTTSMKAALERLGFGPCYHMFEILTHPDQADRWLPLATGASVDWDQVLAGYRSTQDWPASWFWREQAQAYPRAKVVLTVRDPHAWYPSISALLRNGPALGEPAGEQGGDQGQPMAAAAAALDRLRPVLDLIGRSFFGPDWRVGGEMPDEERAVAAFNRHAAAVREAIGPDRLLVFDVREGWGPLCSFLGVPPPAGEAFPHLNDSDWMRQAFEQMRVGGQMPSPFDAHR